MCSAVSLLVLHVFVCLLQLAHNSKGLPLVDVVVDPRLVRHLRPHQREGVLFLYQCVMGMKDYQGLGAILA